MMHRRNIVSGEAGVAEIYIFSDDMLEIINVKEIKAVGIEHLTDLLSCLMHGYKHVSVRYVGAEIAGPQELRRCYPHMDFLGSAFILKMLDYLRASGAADDRVVDHYDAFTANVGFDRHQL